MAGSSNSEGRLLYALRTKGMAETDEVALAAGVEGNRAASLLHELGERGWVRYRDGARRSGWMLLGEGRAEAERWAAAEMQAQGLQAVVKDLYRSFLVLDPKLKAACTDFQVRQDQSMNDHSDPQYDAEVIARLVEINQSVQPILGQLAAYLDRFGHYGPRLDHALRQVQAGEINWFTKPSLDSYHEVWFELHEDLLTTLGIDRATEQAAGSADL